MSVSKEIWKSAAGYESKYIVSNLGNIRHILRKDKNLRPSVGTTGYLTVKVCEIGGKFKTKRLHRIIAETWLENPFNKKEVNHKNGIKTDNRVTNLEWVTPKENTAHSILNGLSKPMTSDTHPMSVKICAYNEDGSIFKIWGSMRMAAKEMKTSHCHLMSRINRNKKFAGFKWGLF